LHLVEVHQNRRRPRNVNVNVKRAQIVDIELATDSNSDATISSENYQNYIMWCCIMCITHKKH